ncbi:MAG: 4-hydroxy-tetrahydrodipicolinate synthase [Bacteroidia bacterium]
MKHIFQGTGVAVVTPFQQNGAIDKPAISRLVEHLVVGKIDYMVVLGSTGEAATLSDAEKEEVIACFLEANQGRLPIVLGAGGNDTRAVAETVATYQKYPVQGILSASPHYNKPSQEGIYRHYKAISEVSEKPIILYNVPGRTASNMLADTTLRIAHDCKNVVAMKEASANLEQMAQIMAGRPEGFALLSGDDPLVLPVISLGGEGIISVLAQAKPLLFSTMVREALAGDFAAARPKHYELIKLTQFAFAEGNPAGIKLILNELGICAPWVRLPLVEGSEKLRAEIRKELAGK